MSDTDEFIAWISDKYPELSETDRDRLLRYGDLLREATDRLGIVSRGDRDRVLMRHVRECLDPGLTARLRSGERVLDVGAGGGLPGIPLAILRPDLRFCLVEPRERKVAFLERACLLLRALNIEVWMGAVEDRARIASRERASVAISRGIRWTEPMVRALVDLMEPGASRVVRFGAVEAMPGVEIVPLEGDPERGVQVWPPETWANLPKAH